MESKSSSLRNSIGFSFFVFLATYVVAFFVAGAFMDMLPHIEILLSSFYGYIVATLVVFIFSLGFRNASLYDAFWSVGPLFLVTYWLNVNGEEVSFRQKMIVVVVLLWSIRLTSNWLRSWPGLSHEDWRYEMIRMKTGKWYPLANLLSIHIFPTILVFVAMLPAYFVLTDLTRSPLNIIDGIALVVGLGGVLISLISDEQLKRFAKVKKEKRITLKTGLWKYSRHPNYLGEFMFWLGLFLFAIASNTAWLWTIVGVIMMLCLFLFASIPMMDKRMNERREDFADYKSKTSSFLLLPSKS